MENCTRINDEVMAMSDIEYRIVKELPKPKRAMKGSAYDDILKRFLSDGKAQFVEITKVDTKAVSLSSSLKSRVKALKVSERVNVKVISGKVYLEKLEKAEA